VVVGNDVFATAVLAPNADRGPLNFGEVRRPSRITSSAPRPTSAGRASRRPSAVDPGNVTTTPAFSVNTGTPGVPEIRRHRSPPRGARRWCGSSITARASNASASSPTRRTTPAACGVATADVDGDGVPDIIAATGQGGGPRVRVFSGVDGSILKDFFAYETNFRGGVFVAAADVNHDGKADIITGTEQGGGPRLTVFDGVTGARIRDFFAFDSAQRGGIRSPPRLQRRRMPTSWLLPAAARRPTCASSTARMSPVPRYFPTSSLTRRTSPAASTSPPATTTATVRPTSSLRGHRRRPARASLSITSPASPSPASSPTIRTTAAAIRLAVQNVDGKLGDEIITGTGIDSAAHVKVWSHAAATPIDDFYAFDARLHRRRVRRLSFALLFPFGERGWG